MVVVKIVQKTRILNLRFLKSVGEDGENGAIKRSVEGTEIGEDCCAIGAVPPIGRVEEAGVMVVEVEEGEDGGASVSERILMEGVWWVDGSLPLLIIVGLHGSDGGSCRDFKLVILADLLPRYAPDRGRLQISHQLSAAHRRT